MYKLDITYYNGDDIKTINTTLPIPHIGEDIVIDNMHYNVQKVYYVYDKDNEYVNIEVK